MFEVTVSGRFTARHQIRLADGALEPEHQHEWHVQLTYGGATLDSRGILVDFTTIRAWLARLLATFENRKLNDLPAFARRNPTAENVAIFLAEALPGDLPGFARLKAIEVEEEPGCVARYFPPG
ncbi:MAG: 6-carboxytetrahydropterin synthase [Planctomycetota bacterium]